MSLIDKSKAEIIARLRLSEAQNGLLEIRIEGLLKLLAEAARKIVDHHEGGHPAPSEFKHGKCPICETEMFQRFDDAQDDANRRA